MKISDRIPLVHIDEILYTFLTREQHANILDIYEYKSGRRFRRRLV